MIRLLKEPCRFAIEAAARIEHVDDKDEAAFLSDRLRDWAQDDADSAEAERCFRRAYDLVGGHYGYCLGRSSTSSVGSKRACLCCANRPQASSLTPRVGLVGAAYGDLGKSARAIEAYEKALALDPDYDLAMLNSAAFTGTAGKRSRL